MFQFDTEQLPLDNPDREAMEERCKQARLKFTRLEIALLTLTVFIILVAGIAIVMFIRHF